MYTLCHYELWRCYELSIEDELQLYLTNSDSSLSSGIPPPRFWSFNSRNTSSVPTTTAVQSNHLQRVHHPCSPVESPPVYPPPWPIAVGVDPSSLRGCTGNVCIAIIVVECNSSVSLYGVGGVLVVGLSMHQPLTFCSCYWLMDEVCCEAFLGNANRTVAVHVLCLLLTLVMR